MPLDKGKKLATEKNTAYEAYDENIENGIPTQDEILMSESDILSGLLELGNEKNDPKNFHKIQIKRDGKLKLEFRIRPLSEEESQICWNNATKFAPHKPGQPKIAIHTDRAKFRSHLIYSATVNEDRAKIWDNKQAQMKLSVIHGVELIDLVLLAGEKDRVTDKIDEISGFNDNLEEIAKN
jgi:hypothetical protein